MYSTKFIAQEDYENFRGVYEDFRLKAESEYNFELEPLDYSGFLEAIEKGLIECIVLYDEHVPIKVAINEAVELAKKYGTDNSASFINGILANVYEQSEEGK